MDEVKAEVSGSTFRRWMAQKKAGKELTYNQRAVEYKENFELAWAFEERRKADMEEIKNTSDR